MSIIFRLLTVIPIHMAFLVCYPEIGPYGIYYLWISTALWTGFMVFIGIQTRILSFLNGFLGYIINLAVFIVMLFFLAFTLPQSDNISVFEKLKTGKYPKLENISLKTIQKAFLPSKMAGAKDLMKANSNLNKAMKGLQGSTK